MIQNLLKTFSDKKLIIETKSAVKKEKHHTYIVLKHLTEIYRRRIYADDNYYSLHDYCIRELGYTSGEAQYRVCAVKLMLGSSKIEMAVKSGKLHLSNAVIMQNYIANQDIKPGLVEREKLVEKVMGKSKRQAKEIIEQIPAAKSPGKISETKKVKIEVDAETKSLLDELAQLSGSNETKTLKEALKEKISELKTKQYTQSNKVTAKPPTHGIRYISTKVKAQVRIRGKNQCEYIDGGQKRCGQYKKLHIDHIKPFAMGGDNSPANLRLLCARHNQREAIKVFGVDKIENCNAGITILDKKKGLSHDNPY